MDRSRKRCQASWELSFPCAIFHREAVTAKRKVESGHCVLLLGRGACWTWAGPSLLGSMSASLVLLEMWALKDGWGKRGGVD